MSMLPVGFGASGDYTIEESLRFNASQSSYLSWTPASAGNRKTWTWSGWVKKANSGIGTFISADPNSGNRATSFYTRSLTDGRLEFEYFDGATTYNLTAVDLLRDPSSFYHLVLVVDTTQATNTNRIKIYKNGVQLTLSGTYVPQNTDMDINNTVRHNLGRFQNGGGATSYFDGYMTEVNFIDGQALDASSFGETDATTGVWKPKGYTGTYGTNGFYLPMKLDNTVEGFNTVTWYGTGSKQQIGGVGFTPDLIWAKSRSNAYPHVLVDSVRGAPIYLQSQSTSAETSDSGYIASIDTDGFTVGSSGALNVAGGSNVAWCWDAGSSTVSNTDGSITSSVRANPTYGFSVVTASASGTSPVTVGHGLGFQPQMIIGKVRDVASTNWYVYTAQIAASDYLVLNSTAAKATSSNIWDIAPTSTVFTIGNPQNGWAAGNSGTHNYVFYCFSEVSGYSKFGSYTGTGASGNVVTTGFKPAFVMIKASNNVTNWMMYDATRDGTSSATKYLTANTSGAEGTLSPSVEFTATGFTVNYNASPLNASGDTYIYMAFKDTREYAFWLDDSGNNNDWQPNGGITTSSTVTDTPTPYLGGGNYAVLNPLNKGPAATITDANLNVSFATTISGSAPSTIGFSSGKYYFEATVINSDSLDIGVVAGNYFGASGGVIANGIGYYRFGEVQRLNSLVVNGLATFTNGDLLGVAINADANQISWYKNGSLVTTQSINITAPYFPAVGDWSTNYANNASANVNFGQRPFAYTPPTGFLPLHTGNLPDSTIVDGSKYFDALLYTGNGSTQSVTGLEFQPDLVWLKSRSTANSNALYDAVRGQGVNGYYGLSSNTTNADIDGTNLSSLDATGFTLGSNTGTNGSGATFVGWNWKANGTGVSNTDGSITSTVSANPTAGFSIVSYTGTGSAATVGHGLGVAPDMVIVKSRDVSRNWPVYSAAQGDATKYLYLNTTGGESGLGTSSTLWNSTAPTSSVIHFGTNSGVNASSENYIAYCFAEVESYSKFGSYLGNGSSDGPFVYTGFRPAFVLVKSSSLAQDWKILDTGRNLYNPQTSLLGANISAAEDTNSLYAIDFLSNGFKLRNTFNYSNGSGATYIYMAFAENPFKNSLAR